jgi:hypothetical protein
MGKSMTMNDMRVSADVAEQRERIQALSLPKQPAQLAPWSSPYWHHPICSSPSCQCPAHPVPLVKPHARPLQVAIPIRTES